MVADVLGIIATGLGSAVSWLTQIFTAVNGVGIVLAAFFLVVSIQLLLTPLRGSGSSDKAKKKKDGGSNE